MHNFWESVKKFLGFKQGESEISNHPVMKKLNTLMIIAAAGILLMVLANLFSPESPTGESNSVGITEKNDGQNVSINSSQDISSLEKTMASNLEEVLREIDGVGEVKVTINLASTAEKDFAINKSVDSKNTQEHDQRGGNRTITETNQQDQMVLVRESQGSREDPVVVKEMKPEVKGVIVLAEGVQDTTIKADVMKAAQVYLDIPLYRVIVLQKESR